MKKRGAALLVLLLTTVTGCLNFKSEEEVPISQTTVPVVSEMPQTQTPQSGGTLRISMRPPSTLNPLLNEDVTVDAILKLLFEPLMALNLNLQPVDNLAGFNFASDGMSVVLTLRNDLFWSDGVAITTRDIAYSLDTLHAAPERAIYKNSVANISPHYVIMDERRIKVQFLQAFGAAAYLFCFPIIPEHYYAGAESEVSMKPLGNGLYVFDSYENLKNMFLHYNPDTYRKKPYIPIIEVLITTDQDTEMDAFGQKLLDAMTSEIADWGRYRNSQETNIDEYITNYFDFIGFNFLNTSLADQRVREAIACLLDVDDIISSVYMGHAKRTNSPVNPDSWLYDDEVVRYAYQPEKAKSLLTQAGYGENQLKLRLLANQENAERVKIMEILKTNLEKAGVAVEAELLPFEAYSQRLNAHEFDLFVGGYHLSVISDLTFAFGSSAAGDNLFSYRDDSMNALLAAAFSAENKTAYIKAMSDVQHKIANNLPCVSLVFRKAVLLSDQNVMGDKKPVMNNVLANINEWYIAR